MVIFQKIPWTIICFLNTIQGLREWPRSVTVPLRNDVRQGLSKLELNNDTKQESQEFFNNNNYLTKLTLSKNFSSNEYTIPTLTDTMYKYNNLVLTTATKNPKQFALDYRNPRKEDIKLLTSNPEQIKTKSEDLKHLAKSEGYDHSRELDLIETSTDENQFWVHTPGRRIFHGHKTRIKHFPFLVTVHVLRRFVCAGSIIKADLVITAAICLKRWQEWLARTTNAMTNETTTDQTTTDPSTNVSKKILRTIEVVSTKKKTKYPSSSSSRESGKSSSFETTVQETTLILQTVPIEPKIGRLVVRAGTNYYRLRGKVMNVIKIYVHPSYSQDNLQNNLLIMRLDKRFSFKHRNIKKIEVSTLAADVPLGTRVTMAGWGAETYHNKVFNALWNLLHKSVVTVSFREQCINTYASKLVDRTNFCALNENNEGACNCDAGDPAVIGGILVGVTSFGSPRCGGPGNPTVFTNLGYYAGWIKEIMDIRTNSSKEKSSESKSKEKKTTETPTMTTSNSSKAPVYYNVENYQQQPLNYDMKMAFEPRDYRRFGDKELGETLSMLSYNKLEEDTGTDNVIDLTTSQVRTWDSSTDHIYDSSDLGTDETTSIESNTRIDNQHLLTPNTPGTEYYNTLKELE